MRYIPFLFIACFFFSCNDAEKKTAPSPVAQSPSAEDSLQNEWKLYPDSVAVLQNLIGFYLDKENYARSSAVADEAIKRDSSNPDFWDIRSVVCVAKGDTAQAVASLQKAIDLYPMPHYIISLGALYAQDKDARALEMADALLIGNKAHAEKEAYFIKGLYYSNSGQKEKAIPFFDQALSHDYQFMDAYVQKAMALYDLKKYNDAVTILRKAVTLQNNFAEGYFQLGQCYEALNKKEDAAESYRKAILYDPNFEEAQEALQQLAN